MRRILLGALFALVLSSASVIAQQPVRPTDGTNLQVLDPCISNTQLVAVVSISTATVTKVITKTASKKNYICAVFLVTTAANNVAIIEGTQTTTACDTGAAGMAGGANAATGQNLAANGGYVLPAALAAYAVSAGTNVDTCLATSAATQLSGVIKYVQQ